jgi:hypothetical protein
MTITGRLILGAVLCVASATRLMADSPLADAKALYASASYEAALEALEGADAGASVSEVLEYRALCLLALGRTADAQRVTEALVTQSPMLVPSFEEFPPRFVSLVTDTRRKLLPQLARELFSNGRDQFHADKKSEATRQFEQVLVLANDPVLRDAADGADLRTLAMGYLDLLRAKPQPALTAPPAVAAATPAPTAARPPVRNGGVVQAVAIRQTLPPWNVRTATTGGELKGALRVLIGVDGRVKTAKVITPTHPAYDSQVLAATRDWLYAPATLDGQAVESERLIDIRVQPY